MKLILGDNVEALINFNNAKARIDVIYGDCIYESFDFRWVDLCYTLLKDSGIFYVQTDHHTVAQYIIYLNSLFGEENFLNMLIYKQEWGGRSKRYFPRKHDTILMYAKGKDYKFNYERILIPKVTANTAFDKNGGMKIPCDVFDDLGNFSTMSNERVKKDGKNIQWQKPLKLMNRLLLPVTDEGDIILDPFMGSGTTGVWCKENNREFIGIENDHEVFHIAREILK